jgi:hypothetical protein
LIRVKKNAILLLGSYQFITIQLTTNDALLKEKVMSRKYIFLTIVAMVLLMFPLVGCSSTPAEMTPTPDLSIVWSDDLKMGIRRGGKIA